MERHWPRLMIVALALGGTVSLFLAIWGIVDYRINLGTEPSSLAEGISLELTILVDKIALGIAAVQAVATALMLTRRRWARLIYTFISLVWALPVLYVQARYITSGSLVMAVATALAIITIVSAVLLWLPQSKPYI